MIRRGTMCATVGLILTMAVGSTAWSHYSSGVENMGERTGSFLSSPFVAAFDPAPAVPRFPASASVPAVPPGMCRWERTVLDNSGRPVLDRYGRPVKEYAIGSCLTPPPY